MEVNGLTSFPINKTGKPVEAVSNLGYGAAHSAPAKQSEIKLEDVTMDLEEMKNFLFMMLRGGAITLEKDVTKIGTLVNRTA
jgi:hypothetical protein